MIRFLINWVENVTWLTKDQRSKHLLEWLLGENLHYRLSWWKQIFNSLIKDRILMRQEIWFSLAVGTIYATLVLEALKWKQLSAKSTVETSYNVIRWHVQDCHCTLQKHSFCVLKVSLISAFQEMSRKYS